MSQRIRVPLSELEQPQSVRITVPVSELKSAQPKEHWLSKTLKFLTPVDELADPKKAIDAGALETLGGVAGGMAAGIPGAMGGAALVRGIRGIVHGEKPGQIAASAAGHGALEALPLVGRGLAKGGRAVLRGVLPVAEKELEQVGKGSMRAGLDTLTQNAIDAPGIRLPTTLKKIGSQPRAGHPGSGRMGELAAERSQLIGDATRRGARIPSENVIGAGEELLSPGGAIREAITTSASDRGARAVVNRFRNRVTRAEPMSDTEVGDAIRSGAARDPNFQAIRSVIDDLTPAEADRMLQATRFFRGGRDVPGAETTGRAMRSALSSELKQAVPGLSGVMAEQEKLIPLRRVLERASVYRSNTLRPEAIVSGAKSRLLGVIPAPRGFTFGAGKLAARTGKALDSPALSGAARTLLMQLLMEQSDQREKK